MEYNVRDEQLLFDEFFRIERSLVKWERFDGVMGPFQTRYVIRRGDSVGILPLLGDPDPSGEQGDRIVLVKQFRYPTAGRGFDGYLWEIPAGMVKSGEDLEETARRELREEIGVEIEKVDHLLSFYLSPGALDEKFHLYGAPLPAGTRLDSTGGNELELENLLVKAFTLCELVEMIQRNEIMDAKTIAAILYFSHV